MYACLHNATGNQLLELALQFSPFVERTSDNTVVFAVTPLRKIFGSVHQIVSEISRYGYEWNCAANLAVASNADTAVLLACHFPGVTLAEPGQERLKLGPIPLSALLKYVSAHDVGGPLCGVEMEDLDLLHRWGLKTCADLADMPETGLAERLGPAGVYLRNLACGIIHRPLRIAQRQTSYDERVELEHTLELLEPLLFLLGRTLGNLCRELRSQARAARRLVACFELEGQREYHCELEFPVPLQDSQTLLKLLQLHLERHPPEAAVVTFTIHLEPTAPKRVQGGFFHPPAPAPEKLQITLSRIRSLVGPENVGTPVILNTHRPDAFELRDSPAMDNGPVEQDAANYLRLAMRIFRPALPAHVRVIAATPKVISASGVQGNVLEYAGPWKTSGEWWASTAWSREEWDVALTNGALYRIYQDLPTHDWFIHAMYD